MEFFIFIVLANTKLLIATDFSMQHIFGGSWKVKAKSNPQYCRECHKLVLPGEASTVSTITYHIWCFPVEVYADTDSMHLKDAK